jgi:uncharacterized protein (DUF1330 family)
MADPPEAERFNAGGFEEFLERSRGDADGPIVMLNLIALKPDGGFAAYGRYGEAVAPLLERAGGRLAFTGAGGAALIGSDQRWDLVLLVEYPSRKAFLEMVGSAEYEAIAHLRTEAITASELRPLDPAPARS